MERQDNARHNLTISLDRLTLRKAKILAARQALALPDDRFHLEGAKPVSRDELHER